MALSQASDFRSLSATERAIAPETQALETTMGVVVTPMALAIF